MKVEKHIGTVKWFNEAKGYGFINEGGDEESEDIFLHFSVIQVPGYKTLSEGQWVVYETAPGPRGILARQVVPIEDPEP